MLMSARKYLRIIEKLHPYQTIMYLGMFGSGLIFLFLALAFFFTHNPALIHLNEIRMPYAFLISSIVMVGSGFYVGRLIPLFEQEKFWEVRKMLSITLMLGLLFIVLQVIGWIELGDMGLHFTGIPYSSFLYVLTGIHIFHLLGALIYGLMITFYFNKIKNDTVKVFLVMINPFEKMKLSLFTLYWYFMDGIWLVLFILFFLSFN
ncbi:hypothetical protein EL17_12265 [Anditalea andensis]|uniref:Heme-copper oxidase subunit III family profile domain-containing protein n=2 Tax=Anditalea andensis TaxID=1048983 RepID=A0A074LH90_9BACT|nr:hypothetical protein EL17_12265 [Anditalea andensis]